MPIDLKKHGEAAISGEMGQIYLARGTRMAMRMWNEPKGQVDSPHLRNYETLGYVLQGRMVLSIQGEQTTLKAGDSWVVPAGAEHYYEILEPLKAIEVTSPPAQDNHQDAPVD